jgi:Tol biopolymer transport system component
MMCTRSDVFCPWSLFLILLVAGWGLALPTQSDAAKAPGGQPMPSVAASPMPVRAQANAVAGELYDMDFGEIILARNDDSYTSEITLPFPVSLYDRVFTSFWINNNGNVTFDGGMSTYTSFAFPGDRIIVAPFFADVDTRHDLSGRVYYKALPDRVVVTWDHVGYFGSHADKRNTFQLIMTSNQLFGFSYAEMQWTTGDASYGSGGFGGSIARAGFDAGNGRNAVVFYQGNTPGSLNNLSNRTLWYTTSGGTPSSIYTPDALIRTDVEVDYTGDNLYNVDEDQTKSMALGTGATAEFFVKVQNDALMPDTLVLSAPPAPNWTIKCFDAITGGNDVAAVLTGPDGLVLEQLGAGEERDYRLEITPGPTVGIGEPLEFAFKVQSQADTTRTDTVIAKVIKEFTRVHPDLSIRGSDSLDYRGENLYNTTGIDQTLLQTTPAGITASYIVTVENDGNRPDSIVLSAPPVVGNWTVRYFDAVTGGNDITPQVTSATGWRLVDMVVNFPKRIRIEVTAAPSVPRGALFQTRLKATSVFNGAVDLVVAAAQSQGRSTFRASVSSTGRQGDGESLSPAINADGTLVVFASSANTLVSGDTNRVADIFLYDRVRWSTRRVSLGLNGAQANDWCGAPAISGNGRYIAYVAQASNLVVDDTNGRADIFLYDRQTGTTTRVSATATQQANGDSATPVISADGRWVAFTSSASNLVAGDTNSVADVFLWARDTGAIMRVSLPDPTLAGVRQANAASDFPAMSADGGTLAFRSFASNLVAGDTNRQPDIFLFTRESDRVSRVSIAGVATQANGPSGINCAPALSADGRLVAFTSHATNLVGDDTNGKLDVFLRDCQAHSTTRVSQSAAGGQGNADSGIRGLALTCDGARIAFASMASNLVPADTNSASDVFVLERNTNTVTRVSLHKNHEQSPGDSGLGERGVAISGDGRFIAFDSVASLEADDTNGQRDVYLRDFALNNVHAFRPDLLVRTATQATFTGDGVFDLGAQTVEKSVGTGQLAVYVLRVKSTSQYADSVVLNGPASASGWGVRYSYGGVDITSEMTGAGWTSPMLTAGTTLDLRVEITPESTVAVGQSNATVICATSSNDLAVGDAVQLMTHKGPLTGVTLAAPPVAGLPNQPVSLTATPQGGDQVEYKFRVALRSGGVLVWETVRDYELAATYSWVPRTPGIYTLLVYARELGSRVAYQFYKTMQYEVSAPAITELTVTTDVASPQRRTTPITITATPTGGQDIRYKFRVGAKMGTAWVWETVQDYSAANSYRWEPATAGTYAIVVYAKNATSMKSYDVYRSVGFRVVP